MTSVIVVTKTLEANAGSIFAFLSDTGTSIPNKPATIIFKTIEMPINKESFTQKDSKIIDNKNTDNPKYSITFKEFVFDPIKKIGIARNVELAIP